MNAYLIVLFAILIQSDLLADIVGSFSTVSVEPFYTFPQVPIDANEMRGFGWFSSGFALQNASTSCLFTDVFPVSGVININGGSFTLSQDFITRNIANLYALGTIIGNGYTMDFCSSITGFGAVSTVFNNTNVVINGDIVLINSLTFQGNCVLVGNGNTITLGSGGGITIDAGGTLTLRNVTLEHVGNNNIACVDNSSRLILDTVNWYQNNDYTFNVGSILFVDHVMFAGDKKYTYASAHTSTIQADATWEITGDMHLIIGQYSPDNNNQPLYMEDSNAQIKFGEAHLTVSQYGIVLTRGTIIFDGITVIDDYSTSTANGIMIGNGISGQDPTLEFKGGASMLLRESNLVFDTSHPDIIITGANQGARLKRYTGSNIYIQSNLKFPSMTIEADSLAIPHMVLADGVIIDFEDAAVIRPDAAFDITSARTDINTYRLHNGNSISLTKGALAVNVYVVGTDNSITGNGAILGAVTLQDADAILNIALQGIIDGNVYLNGGTLNLINDIQISVDSMMSGSGVINMMDKIIDFPFGDYSFTATTLVIANNAAIRLNGLMSLTGTMTIVGDLTIEGNNNVMEIKDGGIIYIRDGSSLTIKNMHFSNLKNDSIVCLGDNARIIVDNTSIGLGGNVTFDVGSILFEHAVDIFGTHTFFYTSSQTSTIGADASVRASNNVQIMFGKNPISQAQPLYFASSTSTLHLDNAGIIIDNTGAQLAGGIILCDNNVSLSVLSTATATGLMLGNGSPQDTTKVVLNAGATLSTLRGMIVYNMGNPNSFVSNTNTSKLIRSSQSATYLLKDVNFSNISIALLATPQLDIPTPQMLNYYNALVLLPTVEFIITGRRYTNSSNLLYGNGLIYMFQGTYPLGTFVSGTGNVIQGNGSIGGPVNFLNSSAQLQWYLNGLLIGNMALNGGTLILGSNINLARGTQITNGVVNMGPYSLIYGSTDLVVSQNNYFSGNIGEVALSANITLDATWTFSQSCILNGRGNSIYMGPNGAIVVEKGSTLRIKNANLEKVHYSNIRCLDDNSSLVLDDVYWQQSGDFIFQHGILSYCNTVEMMATNSYVFAYQSCRTSTINNNAMLQLDSGFTFSYDPIFVASKDLLAFADETSELRMISATLHATVTGMNITKGSIDIQGTCILSSEVELIDPFTRVDEGISLGNQNASEDIYIELDGNAMIALTQGSLHYKNVLPSSLSMFNKSSTISIHQGATLYLSEDLPLGIGALQLQVGAQLIKTKNSANVIGSMFLVE